MKEIEVKILEINKDEIINKLEELSAIKIYDGEIFSEYWDFEDRRLYDDNKQIRIRKYSDKNILTLKEKNNKESNLAKERDEYEVDFSDFKKMKIILEGIGLKKYRESYKYRISYKLGNIHFDLDTYLSIPTFLEIESNNIEDLKKVIKKLGFNLKDTNKMSEMELKNYYSKK